MTTTLGESHRVPDETPPYGDEDAPPVDNVRDLHSRTPQPHLEAERALLGALLLEPGYYDKVAAIVTGDDFDEPRHQTVYDAMVATATREGHPPDRVLVLDQLRADGTLPKVATILFDLPSACPTPSSAATYAQKVHEAADRRRVALRVRAAAAHVDAATPETWHTAIGHAMDELDNALQFAPALHQHFHADLSWLLTGQPPVVDPPTYVRRTAGGALFYPGRVNGIYGDPESAKTWIAQVGIIEALTAGQRAAFIDVDHNGVALTTERLLALGAQPDQLADPDRFRYHEPTDGLELQATIGSLVAWKPDYAVLDSIGEMMPMLGIKSVDNDELSGALRTIATPLAQVGACVVTVDHLPKSHEARTSGFAIGGTAKKRAIDGSYIYAEPKIAPAPGAIGRIILRIEKDRPGRLRATCTGKYIGTLTLDATNPAGITATIEAESVPTNDAGQARPTNRMEAISRYVEDHEACTYRDIKREVRGGDKTLQAAIARLIEEGYMSTFDGANNSIRHHSIAPYREADDDQI